MSNSAFFTSYEEAFLAWAERGGDMYPWNDGIILATTIYKAKMSREDLLPPLVKMTRSDMYHRLAEDAKERHAAAVK